jgi:hypothetical protein
MDYMRDGYLSRVEMKHYLRYLADLQPPKKEFIQFITGKGKAPDKSKSAPVAATNVTEVGLINEGERD